MLLNILKYHETLVKHCDTSCNIVKHREPVVKHHETLLKHCGTSRNTETLAIRCDAIVARCGDLGARLEFPMISARSLRRYRRGVGITPQMCNKVTNHGDMGTFSKQACGGCVRQKVTT